MSKKNLARTLIEGGRHGWNKWERRHETRLERGRTRRWLHATVHDYNLVDEEVAPLRQPVRKEFSDKPSPFKRWLAAQDGRRWDDVYAELCEMFDARTTSGRHLLHDHVLSYVNFDTDVYPQWRFSAAIVRNRDVLTVELGVLHFYAKTRSSHGGGDLYRRNLVAWAHGQIGNRRICVVGSEVFWYEPVKVVTGLVDGTWQSYVRAWRQGKPLTTGQYDAWARLSGAEQDALAGI